MQKNTSNDKLTPKKLNIISWGTMFYGFFFGIYGLTEISNDAGVFVFVCGLFFTAAGVVGIVVLRKKKSAYAQDSMNRVLYELIKKNNGRITLVEFAIASNLEPGEARKFLESKATQFGTVVDVDNEGTINYIFK
jgi:hypothetical protein